MTQKIMQIFLEAQMKTLILHNIVKTCGKKKKITDPNSIEFIEDRNRNRCIRFNKNDRFKYRF